VCGEDGVGESRRTLDQHIVSQLGHVPAASQKKIGIPLVSLQPDIVDKKTNTKVCQ